MTIYNKNEDKTKQNDWGKWAAVLTQATSQAEMPGVVSVNFFRSLIRVCIFLWKYGNILLYESD